MMEPIGRAWIKNDWKNIYSMSQVKRGQYKGWVRVEYIHRAHKTKKVVVRPADVRPRGKK